MTTPNSPYPRPTPCRPTVRVGVPSCRPPTISRHCSELGAGTLLALWVAMALLSAGMVAVLWAAVSVGTHRVAAAADLVALSAAQALQSGEDDPCRTARRIAANQRVDLHSCQVEGETVAIEVGVVLHFGLLGSPTVSTPARAGPAG
ncbi:flp pilus-assembly TadE/G-like family protein [Kribbella qitaiheensis]|uniref:Flp pilus-assembly TadE/G-like family protein n=1 Tax=Kribbella qitaiheensis TaxID=1544730 RepID=A0A7G6X257_9ACTN|nr:Rv3654c family TadE-like protein [Kribbella qitaiheensis]QNE20322.1 flp pilus-assembly TadE/G-like family protein [Kribbella qitaiheensis]